MGTKFFRLSIKPHYRGKNKNFYEYEGKVIEIDSDTGLATDVYLVVSPKRRDAKASAIAAKQRFDEVRRLTLLHGEQLGPQLAEQRRVLPLGGGMSGRTHTPQARERIAEGVRKRWAQGAYGNAKVGRPTAAEAAKKRQDAADLQVQLKVVLKQRRAMERKGIPPPPHPLVERYTGRKRRELEQEKAEAAAAPLPTNAPHAPAKPWVLVKRIR